MSLFLQLSYCISSVRVCKNSSPIQISNIYWNSCVFIDVMPNEIIALSSFSQICIKFIKENVAFFDHSVTEYNTLEKILLLSYFCEKCNSMIQ